jgi:hypothetical protein
VSASVSRRGRSRRANSPASSATDPASYTPEFSWQGNELYCEGVRLGEIANRVGTPAYVYSAASISGAYGRLDRALKRQPHTICYSVKANSNLSILRLLARLGSGFDIVSIGELFRLQRAGVDAQSIVFSGAGKSREEIREALRGRIGTRYSCQRGISRRPLRACGHPRESRREGRRAPAHLYRPPQP